MNVVIVGQGDIGLLFYNFISKTSTSKYIKLRSKSKDSLSLRPSYPVKSDDENTFYQFTDIHGASSSQPLTYANDKAVQNADILLFTVKSYQVKQAITDIEQLISAKAVIVLCHNGMGTADELSSSLGKSQLILAMLTTHGCLKYSPLNIIHTGLGHVDFGIIANPLKPSNFNKVTKKLTQLLAPATFHNNISEKQWVKLAINCVINPLTALYDMNNSGIVKQEYSAQCNDILQEVILIAQTQNITLNIDYLIDIVKKVAQATANNSSSMRCDIIANKPTEIDYINGYVHRLGKKFTIATPINSLLWQKITLISKPVSKL
jgi:2-dehydropantoate 2-reductase